MFYYKEISEIFYILYILFIFLIKLTITNYYDKNNNTKRLVLIKNLTNKLLKKNVIYLKIFQTLCINKKFLTEKESNFLIKYTDNVPYNIEDIDYKLLDDICKQEPKLIIDKNVINSGIVAIVFKGTYNGNKIVLKLIKKNIKDKIINIFKILDLIGYITLYIPIICNFNLPNFFNDNKEIILNQTDFNKETDNLIQFKDCYNNLPEYVIPTVYPEFTNKYKNIIIMEDITGLRFNDLDKLSQTDRCHFAEIYIKFGYLGLLFFSKINNDLHVGNLFFYIDNKSNIKYKLGIIDFGICTFPSKNNQALYWKFFYDIIYKNNTNLPFQDIIPQLLDNPEIFINLNSYNKKKLINQLINCINTNKITQDCLQISKDMSYILKKYNLIFSKELNQLIFGLGIVYNFCNYLTDDIIKVQNKILEDLTDISNMIEID